MHQTYGHLTPSICFPQLLLWHSCVNVEIQNIPICQLHNCRVMRNCASKVHPQALSLLVRCKPYQNSIGGCVGCTWGSFFSNLFSFFISLDPPLSEFLAASKIVMLSCARTRQSFCFGLKDGGQSFVNRYCLNSMQIRLNLRA